MPDITKLKVDPRGEGFEFVTTEYNDRERKAFNAGYNTACNLFNKEAVKHIHQQRHAAKAKAKPCPICNDTKVKTESIDLNGMYKLTVVPCPKCVGTASA